MEEVKKLTGRAIVSFISSLLLCFLFIGGIILYRADYKNWHRSPENIALIIAALLISFLLLWVTQNNFTIKQFRAYFQNMVTTDPLTLVYNRRYIDENLNTLIESIARAKGVLTLMEVDIDYFRKYNDIYGYNRGDHCLKIVANVINQSIKKNNDFVARYTGKGFLVVLPNTDEKGAHLVANRLLKYIKNCNIQHEKNEAANCVTVSIGVTTGYGEHLHTAKDYLAKANEALIMSWRNGCNTYTFLKMRE